MPIYGFLLTGDNGANTLQGGPGAELIYGFDPNGPQGNVQRDRRDPRRRGIAEPVFADRRRAATSRGSSSSRRAAASRSSTSRRASSGARSSTSRARSTVGEQRPPRPRLPPRLRHERRSSTSISSTCRPATPRSAATRSRRQPEPSPMRRARSSSPPSTIRRRAPIHRAGWIGFGPDGYLYVATGDGADRSGDRAATSTPRSARSCASTSTPTRSRTIRARNYAIPADNPASSTASPAAPARTEIFAAGLRNPFRDSFDRGLGDLFIADVGAGLLGGDQPRRAPARITAGRAPRGPSTGRLPEPSRSPIHAYPTTAAGASVTGGYVYRGESEGLHGQYFFADFVTGQVWTLHNDGGAVDRDRAHRPDRRRCRARSTTSPPSARTARQPLPGRLRRRHLPPDAARRLRRPGDDSWAAPATTCSRRSRRRPRLPARRARTSPSAASATTGSTAARGRPARRRSRVRYGIVRCRAAGHADQPHRPGHDRRH